MKNISRMFVMMLVMGFVSIGLIQARAEAVMMLEDQNETCQITTDSTNGTMNIREAWNPNAETTTCTSLQHCREVCISQGYKNYLEKCLE